VTGPAHGTLTFNANGSYSYTAFRQPTVGFVGSDNFPYNNAEADGPHTVSISITPVNDSSVAMDQAFTFQTGSTHHGQLTATDVDGDALTYSLIAAPALGVLELSPDGQFTYSADIGEGGADSFIFQASDGLADSNSATVTITVVFSEPPVVSCDNENTAAIATTPSAAFIDHADGTVTHDLTGLTWMRCSLGQSWDPETRICTGVANEYSWLAAFAAASELNATGGYAGQTDWRLPNKNELASIVEERCWSPAANQAIFPATPSRNFWSSSPNQENEEAAWMVSFDFGEIVSSLKWAPAPVRLLRAVDPGQPQAER
jgi:VCBS repeat-containing protein